MKPRLLQIQFVLSTSGIAHASFDNDGNFREIVGYVRDLTPAEYDEAAGIVVRLQSALAQPRSD